MSFTTHLQLRAQLRELIRDRSYREGDFTLVSGQKSKFYIDLKATTLHPKGAALIGRLTVELARSRALQFEGVGGMTLGADPLATAISLVAHEQGFFWPAFIVRKEPKSHGTSRFVEGVENLKPGARLLVVEDVVTTGGSSLKAIERLREAGFDPRAVLTVVDREQGGAETFRSAGLELLSLFTLKEIQEA